MTHPHQKKQRISIKMNHPPHLPPLPHPQIKHLHAIFGILWSWGVSLFSLQECDLLAINLITKSSVSWLRWRELAQPFAGSWGRKWHKQLSRWWFQGLFYVHPYPGRWSNLTNIFQLGWKTTNWMVVFVGRDAFFPKLTLRDFGNEFKNQLAQHFMELRCCISGEAKLAPNRTKRIMKTCWRISEDLINCPAVFLRAAFWFTKSHFISFQRNWVRFLGSFPNLSREYFLRESFEK